MAQLPTVDHYLDIVLKVYENNPSWRIGQAHFNVLCDIRPDISENGVRGTELDPFYQDVRIPQYVQWLRDNWDAWGTIQGIDIKQWYLDNPQPWFETDIEENNAWK